jgi:hypothetical protein
MTRLLEQAVEAVSALPDEEQDDLARILLQLAGVDQPPYQLTREEAADLDASLVEAARGEFATDEEVCAHLGEAWAVKAPLHGLGAVVPPLGTDRGRNACRTLIVNNL